MKILMINGSPHPRGCTYTALHEMERVLRAAGAEVQILTVGAEQIGGCVACGGCRATGRCVRGGLVNDAIDAMETADALVLASPVHYAGISGAMSAFCDRLFYAGGSWANKPCFFARRLPVMCSTVRHMTVVAGMTAFEYGKSGARYCAMSTRSARSLSASGTTEMRP